MSNGVPENLADALDVLGYSDSDGLMTAVDAEVRPTQADVTSRVYLWRDMYTRVGLDAAFFHDGVPLVGFSDCTEGDGLLALRKRLWNYGRVPILIVATQHGIEAYNGVNLPEASENDQLPLLPETQQRSVAASLVDAFSRRNVQAGRFASTFEASYNQTNRVDQGLLTNLRVLRRKIAESDQVSRAGLDVLIGASLTASYLAHRGVLDDDHMEELCGVTTLDEALRHGRSRVTALFAGLAERFNGDVFGSVESAIAPLDDSVFEDVASLLQGDNLSTKQGSLWPYDFAVLPPDLVTSVYEQLLESHQRRDAAYYTPRSIVDLILDEIIPWSESRTPKLIDLACGSGAFLTEAFRRLAFKASVKKASQLTYRELSRLLTGHIFGVDINPGAARVAAFGAYLALLEEVEPPTIWRTVTLPKLIGTNIVVADAFEGHSLRTQSFDAVVSNPPWKQAMSEAAGKYVKARELPVGHNQIAQAFVWLAEEMLKPGGRLGLVMPAKGLLHNRSPVDQRFRAELFTKLDARSVVDLSPVRRSLFAGAIGPPALLIADKPAGRKHRQQGRREEIIHIVVHPRPFSQVAGALVIAPEDLNVVTRAQARSRPEIWKPLVWGAQRDLDLLDRLRAKHALLGEIVGERGWFIGQGYKEADKQQQKDSSYLIDLPVVDMSSVLPFEQPRFLPHRFNRATLHRPRTRDQYRAPQILIRRTLPHGRLAAGLLLEDAVYTSELMSISGPSDDEINLALVAATISSSFGNYWQFMTSASWGVERDSVEENELLAMPVPPMPVSDSQLAASIRLAISPDKAVRHRGETVSLLDDLIFDLFGLGAADRLRIRKGVTENIGRFESGPTFAPSGDPEVMQQYCQILQTSLSHSLAHVQVEVSVGSVRDGGYASVWVEFRDSNVPQEEMIPKIAERTVNTDEILRSGAVASAGTIGMVSLPAAFLVDEDTVYLVKTADRDRWSYDAALNDASRIFAALAFGS